MKRKKSKASKQHIKGAQKKHTPFNINVCIFEWQWECDDSENPFKIDVGVVGNFRFLNGGE